MPWFKVYYLVLSLTAALSSSDAHDEGSCARLHAGGCRRKILWVVGRESSVLKYLHNVKQIVLQRPFSQCGDLQMIHWTSCVKATSCWCTTRLQIPSGINILHLNCLKLQRTTWVFAITCFAQVSLTSSVWALWRHPLLAATDQLRSRVRRESQRFAPRAARSTFHFIHVA